MKKKYLTSFIPWIIGFQAVSILMGLITRGGLEPWYITLEKSSLTPPGYVFGIVWPILYVFLAIFGKLIHDKAKVKSIPYLIPIFWFQMILNWLWSPIFFYLQLTATALVIIMILILSNATIIFKSVKGNEAKQTLLIIPYFIWLCFACYLNFIIVILN